MRKTNKHIHPFPDYRAFAAWFPMNHSSPEDLFRRAVFYLLANDWARDGDDRGMWTHERVVSITGAPGPFWFSIGQALIMQWEWDGISMLSAL